MTDLESIPGPYGLPIIGNLLDLVGEEASINALERLADQYGPIYQLHINGKRMVVCSSAELVGELVDERNFIKQPPSALTEGTKPKGLFTAASDDPDWGQAHRILTKPMGPLSVEEMFDDMKDVANQLVLKWARQGPEQRIAATDDFTRLTLDTIALCTMAYRFNSFYSSEMHPFVGAMVRVLEYSGQKSRRPAFLNALHYSANAQHAQDEEMMEKIGQNIIQNRRVNPTEKRDLLNAMIYGVDPKTKEPMRDGLITAEMTTFLIAGHETTSGLLSFTFYYLIKNREAYATAREEIDNVVGNGSVQLQHLNKLKYLEACLRESIRLSPTAPAMSKQINPRLAGETVLLGGKYKIEPTDRILCLFTKSQKDPDVYGKDAGDFRPERMLDDEFDKLPSGAWKPFGDGSRACIGRPFAWQEALLVSAMILQNYDLQLDDPSYELHLKQTLTIKPKDFYIRASLRPGLDATTLDRLLHSAGPVERHSEGIPQGLHSDDSAGPMLILYGSNTGTCQAFAQSLASDVATKGFVPEIREMDTAVKSLSKSRPIVMITSSYEGQPPDNAALFVEWLENGVKHSLDGVRFAVFGCGHKDWAKTLHRIPKLVDQILGEYGAHRIAPMGRTDASKGNMFGDFEDWVDVTLLPALRTKVDNSNKEAMLDIEISTNARASSLRQDVKLAIVRSNKILTAPGEPQKWYMDLKVPSGSNYECGDYLAVLPLNTEESVKQIMAHFKLPWDAVLTLKPSVPSTIPTNTPLSVYDVLRSYVELAQPATKKDLKTCLQHTSSERLATYLTNLMSDPATFEAEILGRRTSVFNILRNHPDVKLPFARVLSLLPPLRVRQYSISSSPLRDPTTVSITYAVIADIAKADPNTVFHGVAGAYLASLSEGDSVQVSIRPTANSRFRLPETPTETPLIMFAAGTGIAPFRGFIQQRAEMKNRDPSIKLARAVLFVGCRSESKDRLHAVEMDQWADDGFVDVRYSFSKDSDHQRSDGCKYVSQRMVKDKEIIKELWRQGARVYVCGSHAFEQTIGEAARKIVLEVMRESGQDEDVGKWFEKGAAGRIASDVFE